MHKSITMPTNKNYCFGLKAIHYDYKRLKVKQAAILHSVSTANNSPGKKINQSRAIDLFSLKVFSLKTNLYGFFIYKNIIFGNRE